MSVSGEPTASAGIDADLAFQDGNDKAAGISIVDGINLALMALPVAARTTVRHIMGSSKPSEYLDLKSEVIVAVVRALAVPQKPPLSRLPFLGSVFSEPVSSSSDASSQPLPAGARSITETQRLLNSDSGVRGPLWVSKYTAPGGANAEENAGLCDALADVVKRLYKEEGDGRSGKAFPDIKWPEVAPVEAEWTGHRTGAREGATLPTYTDEPERYEALMSHVTAPQPTTVLYLHGGAMYLLDPATHRHVTHTLARQVGGRCYSVRYRLAPQSAFPTQILDALVSYMTLLYPPPGAFHEPVLAKHIVFAGDSAGGNLCLALTRVLLEFEKHNTRVMWHGTKRQVPLPAGLALNSPWTDISSSSPSWQPSPESGLADFDYLPPMSVPCPDALNRPSCEAWPASPPRRFIYTEASLATHPLVSMLFSNPDGWRGAPPMYVCAGWELLADEICFFTATRLYNGGKGVKAVTFEQYEAMPHCFALLLSHSSGAQRCFDGWAGFIRRAVEQPESFTESTFTHIKAKTLQASPIEPETLIPYTEEQIRAVVSKKLAKVEAEWVTSRPTAK